MKPRKCNIDTSGECGNYPTYEFRLGILVIYTCDYHKGEEELKDWRKKLIDKGLGETKLMNFPDLVNATRDAIAEYKDAQTKFDGAQVRFYMKHLMQRIMEKREEPYAFHKGEELHISVPTGEPLIMGFQTDYLIKVFEAVAKGMGV